MIYKSVQHADLLRPKDVCIYMVLTVVRAYSVHEKPYSQWFECDSCINICKRCERGSMRT